MKPAEDEPSNESPKAPEKTRPSVLQSQSWVFWYILIFWGCWLTLALQSMPTTGLTGTGILFLVAGGCIMAATLIAAWRSPPPVRTQSIVLRNYWAGAFVWLFATAWMAMTLIATVKFDSVMAVSWLWALGLGVIALALVIPTIRVDISAAGVSIRERTILSKRDRVFAAKDVSVSDVIKTPGDADSLDSYCCYLLLPTAGPGSAREQIKLVQDNYVSPVEQVHLRAIAALEAAQREA